MSDALTTAPARSRVGAWLPDRVDGRIRLFAWLSFLSEVTIIATGGAVRLTGSGLGCSEWPLCTPDSLVPTGELGIHEAIEFGNRMMSAVVVGPLALIVLLLVWRIRHQRRDLFALSVVVLAGVLAQAVVGGITVWTGLNPWIVGFHYAASLLLVCVTTAFLVRMYQPGGRRERVVPVWFAALTHVTGLVLAVTVAFGVLTTASGPHSGDADVVRNGFDATVVAHVHSWPGYALAVLVAVLTVTAVARSLAPRRWLLALSAVVVVQIAVGVWQAREGLPPVLVGIHMVLAALASAAYTVSVLRLKRPV